MSFMMYRVVHDKIFYQMKILLNSDTILNLMVYNVSNIYTFRRLPNTVTGLSLYKSYVQHDLSELTTRDPRVVQ